MAREVRIERRGKAGLDAAEKLYVTRDADGNRLLPAPTGEALYETLTAPLAAAAASTQEIGEQVEASAAALQARFPAPRTITYADAQAAGGTVQLVTGDVATLNTTAGSFVAALPANPTPGTRVTLRGIGWATSPLTITAEQPIAEPLDDGIADADGVEVVLTYTGALWSVVVNKVLGG